LDEVVVVVVPVLPAAALDATLASPPVVSKPQADHAP
jgi:hypothetical protein